MDEQQRAAYERALRDARRQIETEASGPEVCPLPPTTLTPKWPGDRPEHYDEHGRLLCQPFVSARTTLPGAHHADP
jgi:hypothetical protein